MKFEELMNNVLNESADFLTNAKINHNDYSNLDEVIKTLKIQEKWFFNLIKKDFIKFPKNINIDIYNNRNKINLYFRGIQPILKYNHIKLIENITLREINNKLEIYLNKQLIGTIFLTIDHINKGISVFSKYTGMKHFTKPTITKAIDFILQKSSKYISVDQAILNKFFK